LKRSVLLATGFAVAIAVAVPLLGGTGALAIAAGNGVALSASTVGVTAVAGAGAGTSSATTGPASNDPSAAASSATASGDSGSAAAASSAAASGATGSTASASYPTTQSSSTDASSAGSGGVVWSNSSAPSIARGVTSDGNSVPGATARLEANGTQAIVRDTAQSAAPAAPAPPKACPSNVTGTPKTVPGTIVSGEGVEGTTDDDLASFALQYNAIRVANCLPPIPLANIRYDSCLQARMFWIAEDPSTNPASAWGHGVPRSDGKKIVGCDGDIAGGMGDTGTTAAQKWWDSSDHRQSLYQPEWGNASYSNVCIGFAISHGGIPNDPVTFSRESARWEDCSTFGK
jgi:hypothetical protein